MSKKNNLDNRIYEANMWLENALSSFFEAHHKKQMSESIKQGLKRKKKVLEKGRRSYNTRNIKK